MGSIRKTINQMTKQASTQAIERQAYNATLQKIAALKMAQEAAEAIAEEAIAEEAIAEHEMAEGEEGEEAALLELLEKAEGDTLSDEEKDSLLELADAIEDEEAALVGEDKVATVMDYVALLNYLGM